MSIVKIGSLTIPELYGFQNQHQISASLKGENLYTRDVFVPEKTVQETSVKSMMDI